jgi:hypothetical protein
MCPVTPAGNFLAWNKNSAKSASFSVFRHALIETRLNKKDMQKGIDASFCCRYDDIES